MIFAHRTYTQEENNMWLGTSDDTSPYTFSQASPEFVDPFGYNGGYHSGGHNFDVSSTNSQKARCDILPARLHYLNTDDIESFVDALSSPEFDLSTSTPNLSFSSSITSSTSSSSKSFVDYKDFDDEFWPMPTLYDIVQGYVAYPPCYEALVQSERQKMRDRGEKWATFDMDDESSAFDSDEDIAVDSSPESAMDASISE
ncbi:hypothetical protein C8J56DRAFT_1046113 [Mycena floridula]|nr:hypothetical protein C8J56DRAFT_1046113 [Mycena floridula]